MNNTAPANFTADEPINETLLDRVTQWKQPEASLLSPATA